MEPLPPLYTAPLFAPLHAELLSLLRALTPEDWERPTLARAWRVKDVAAHLLDTQLRKLSAQRDRSRSGLEEFGGVEWDSRPLAGRSGARTSRRDRAAAG